MLCGYCSHYHDCDKIVRGTGPHQARRECFELSDEYIHDPLCKVIKFPRCKGKHIWLMGTEQATLCGKPVVSCTWVNDGHATCQECLWELQRRSAYMRSESGDPDLYDVYLKS